MLFWREKYIVFQRELVIRATDQKEKCLNFGMSQFWLSLLVFSTFIESFANKATKAFSPNHLS